jgi:membrane protease YdiL (CAAX protease family)
MRQTGFVLVDGDGAGRAPAVPRHWLVCAAFCLIFIWLMHLLSRLCDTTILLFVKDAGTDAFVQMYVVLWLIGCAMFGMGLVAWLTLYLSRRFDGRDFRALGLNADALEAAPQWTVAAIAISAPSIAYLLFSPEGWPQVAMQALLVLVPVIIVQAGAEEILFRGAILTSLAAKYGARRGILFSAIMFAVCHGYVEQPIVDFVVRGGGAFVFGLMAGLLALHQGHLGGVIALHVVWNLVAGVHSGLADWPQSSFWTSFAANFFGPITPEEIFTQAMANTFLIPLLMEAALILFVAREAFARILAER